MKAKHLLKSHVTIMDYAKHKMVYPTSVYSAINAGKIKPDIIGLSRIKMIDLKIYGAYKFELHKADKALMIQWFERKGKKRK
jgi:hypothetical protein